MMEDDKESKDDSYYPTFTVRIRGMVFNTTWKIFQLYHGDLFYLWREPEYHGENNRPTASN